MSEYPAYLEAAPCPSLRAAFSYSQAQLAALQCPEIPRAYAMRGDLAIVWIDDRRQALAIVNGRGAAVRCEDGGVREVPYIANAVRAWKV